MSVVDEIKHKIDIVDYIQRYVPLKRTGKHYKAPCPFHTERTASFVVNQDRQSWHCFGACATGGDIFTFAQKFHNWSFPEALQELGKIAGIEVREQSPEQKQQTEAADRLRGLLNTLALEYHHNLYKADNPKAVATLKYLREKRGLTDETILAFGMGYAPASFDYAIKYLTNLGASEDDLVLAGIASKNDKGRVYDRFRDRLTIPISDERGRVVGFGARALNPDDIPKYLNSPQTPIFDKSRLLYGLHMAKNAIRDTGSAVIVEGYLDAIQAHQAGFNNVVAQMGTAMTDAQLKQLAPLWAKRIIMALDADAAGQSATMRGLEVARQALQADYTGKLSADIRILVIPDAKDPDDFIRESPEAWATLIENAMPVSDYVIETETSTLPERATVQEREAVARRILPILLASESDLYKKDNLQKLAIKLRIGERDLLMWAGEQQRINEATAPRPQQPPPATDNDIVIYGSSIEPPPFDYDEGGQTVSIHDAAIPRASAQDSALESQLLRLLLRNPELLYYVNRKFRELAGGDHALEHDTLSDLKPEDFTRSDHRALMSLFIVALEQDDLDLLHYMQTNVPQGLEPVLERLLAEDIDIYHDRIGRRMMADLTASVKQAGRMSAPVDDRQEITDKAIRLRIERLRQDMQEIAYLQMEITDMEFLQQIWLASKAKQILETELQRQISLSKQM